MMKRSLPYIILVVSTSLWCMVLVLPPLSASFHLLPASVSGQIYRIYSLVCHQYDSRSLHINGCKLAVCCRCTAIYFGFLAGVLCIPIFSHKKISSIRLWMVIAVLPMAVDVTLDTFAIHGSDMYARLSTGGFFGVVAALIITPIFTEGCSEILHRMSNNIRSSS